MPAPLAAPDQKEEHAEDGLPRFPKLPETPKFKWGTKEAPEFIRDVNQAFDVIAKWRKNVFRLPSGSAGKHFTQAKAEMYAAYGERSPMECIALKAAAIMAPLLLQQPAAKPAYRDNVKHLARRLELWQAGNIRELLKEGCQIQNQLENSTKSPSDTALSKRFATLVFNNNLKGAMSLLTNQAKGGVLPLNDKTKNEMASKHPSAEPAHPEALLSGPVPPSLHPVFYDALNGELIKKCTLRTKGSAGVSQQEDNLWHKMVTGHKEASAQICNAVASVARRLATEYVDPEGLEALLANRGIALNKNPGLRPVGVGEMVRRIIGKAVMSVTGEQVQKAVGALQLCAGQPAGVKSAIHAMRGFLDDDESDGILLIDADNAFNRVNRSVALLNIQKICPAMKHILINFYRTPTRIIMKGDGFHQLWSREGTTQGCPLAMAMYALALVPLSRHLQPMCKQVWYADDATGCDKLEKMRKWFDELRKVGPSYGYFPKPEKCILVVKAGRMEQANKIFKGTGVLVQTEGTKDTGVEINSQGTRHLGAAVGNSEFRAEYVNKKVNTWIKAVEKLADIAATQPHAAFAAFTQSLQGQWTFLTRAMPDVDQLFKPLEEVIRHKFIRALLRRQVNDRERDLLALPARMGGMGINKPTETCLVSSANSAFISEPLVRLIQRQMFDFEPRELADDMKALRAQVDASSDKLAQTRLKDVLENDCPLELKIAVRAASEKGASSWVTAMPLFDHATVLHKRDFVDAVYIRYGWELHDLQVTCRCGKAMNVTHALDCKYGGLRIIQHNEVRDTIAQCMEEAGCKLVETEPKLQPLDGEEFEYKTANKEDEARSDIKCCGFWSKLRSAYFDVRVVSPFAKSNVTLEPLSCSTSTRKRRFASTESGSRKSSALTSHLLCSPALEAWLPKVTW